MVGKVLLEKESFPEGTSKVGNGHPWDTKKLRRLRRKQRRQLRALPGRVVAGLHAPRPAITLEGDGAVVELELRRRAKGCIEREGAADVLDELESRLPETYATIGRCVWYSFATETRMPASTGSSRDLVVATA